MLVIKRDFFKYTGLILALVVSICLPYLFRPYHFLGTGHSLVHTLIGESVFWILYLLLYINVRAGEQVPFLSFTNGQSVLTSIGWGIIIFISLYIAVIIYGLLYFAIAKAHPPHEEIMDRVSKFPVWLKLLLCIRAGVTEETFFRGYGISRIESLTGSKVAAVAITTLFFGFGHLIYGTVNHVLGTMVIGFILTMYYLKTRNLLSCIIAHFLFDAIAMLFVHHS